MQDCLFCSIVKGKVQSSVVYEDENCLAFLDINPCAPGHTLLVPKKHASRVEDLTEDESGALFRALHRLLLPIREAMQADATTIGVNNGPGSGQEIRHVHIHIIPRKRGDHGTIVQSMVRSGERGNLDEVARTIRGRLKLYSL